MEGLVDERGRISDPYRNFIGISRYARWRDEDNRRESWVETANRYVDSIVDHLTVNVGYTPPIEQINTVRNYILEHKALPSMRALMTAGPALSRNNIAGYNCSYVVVDDPVALDEILYILMNGTGVGFSAEKKYTEKLPVVPRSWVVRPDYVIKVEDSKEGWAYAYRELVSCLYRGIIPTWDVSEVRPAGARLKIFGGRASGPEPLVELFRFTIKQFTPGGRKAVNSARGS
jgi:ribonucleoside-triphosphate reductase